MAEDTINVDGNAPSFPDNYNFASMTGYDSQPRPTTKPRLVKAFNDGTATALFLQQCMTNWDKNPTGVEQMLCKAAWAEQQRIDGGQTVYYTAFNLAPDLWDPHKQTDLTKDAMAPLAALYHYAFGDGSPLSVSLDRLSFNFNRQNLIPVDTILKTASIGKFDINQNIGYDFRGSSYWEWSYLGRISLNLRGILTVDAAGNWAFDGKVIGFSDRYDANKDVKRGKVGELLTNVLRLIPGKEYEIYFNGEHPVNLNGKR